MSKAKFAWLATSLAIAPAAMAAPPGKIDSVQMPAWVERHGETKPMTLGMVLKHGDKLRTGRAGRVHLKLADGSRIKLGERAVVDFYSLSLRPERHLRAALNVTSGAIRLKIAAPSDIDLRVGKLKPGMKVADLWGRADAAADIVCVLAGPAELSRTCGRREAADGWRYLVAPRDGEPLALVPLESVQWQQWARETEVVAGDGAVRRTGKWKVLVGASEDEQAALALYDQARDAGYAAQIRPVAASGGKWNYQVLIAHFDNLRDANVLAKRIEADTGFAANVTR